MFKKDFPYFNNNQITYLDNAATTQKPYCVIEALRDYYTNYCANTHRSNYSHANKATLEYEKARTRLKEFINAKENEEIIFTKGVTESINFLAHSLVKDQIDTIIISSLEHHSNIVPWHMLGKSLHHGLEVIQCDKNLDFDMLHFEKLLKQFPNSLVSITHISNAFGKIHDIKAISNLSHKYNSKILVDGAQALAHIPVDVQDLDVDFYAISSHKTFGPTGVGALYIKETNLPLIKPYQTGGATINDVTYERSELLDSPYVFEAGTQNIAGVIGFSQALKYVQSIGYQAIHNKELILYKYLYACLEDIEDIIFYTNTNHCIGSLSFNIKNIVPEDVGILLGKMNVAVRCGHHCAQPIMKALNIEGTIRVSLAFYNNKKDIDHLIDALEKALYMLKD